MCRVVVLLLRACHPVPCAAVTVFTTVLGAKAGNSAATCGLLALAVLLGQLSIGWSNDRLDAARDRAAGRTEKPLAHDGAARRIVERAIVVALAGTIAFSLALGWRAGLLHMFAVGCGWLYNTVFKSTWLSWLPYAVAFGALPAIATLARADHQAPTPWAVVAAALLGVTAHITNTLPDLQGDRATGIAGFPHRIGARAALLVAAAALLAGSLVLVLGPVGDPSAVRWAGLGIVIALTVSGSSLAWRRADLSWPFYATIVVVGLDLALLVLGPSFGEG
jgi:4-hydroxybenzoate polyprenyltransferase